jgi:hypothetical protein
MKTFIIKLKEFSKHNKGINAELSLCEYFHIERKALDNKPYNVASDIEIGDKKISVKSARFTLISGTLCNNSTDFNEIWNFYKATTHSNTFIYVSLTGKCYEMNIDEFERFVFAFCELQKDSSSNKGKTKIRAKHESKALIEFLENL